MLALVKVSKGAKTRNRYNQVPPLTQDTSGESDKLTVKHHKREPRGQPFPSRRPQSAYKQTCTKAKQTQDRKKTHKRSTKKYRLGTVSKIFY